MATNLLDLLPTPGTMAMRVLIAVVGSGVIGLGIFFYLPANIVPLAPDAAMAAVAEACRKPTGPTKVVFDIAIVIVALILCLSVMGSLGSVGIGTVISALLLGTYLGFYNRRFGHLLDKFLNG
jgi:uncharacterized membrane protein YczE